jgi:CRISPR type II-A-associated protein Csn2
MILKNDKYECNLYFNDNTIPTIIAEDFSCLFQLQHDLSKQCDGEIGDFSIYDDDKVFNFENEVEIIDNPFSININSRKTINYLYKHLAKNFSSSPYIGDFNKISNQIFELLDNLKKDTFYNFIYDKSIDIDDIIKITSVRYNVSYRNPDELLCSYIDILKETSKIKIVFFFHLLYLFPENVVLQILQHCRRNNFMPIIVEKSSSPILSSKKEYFQIFRIDQTMIYRNN